MSQGPCRVCGSNELVSHRKEGVYQDATRCTLCQAQAKKKDEDGKREVGKPTLSVTLGDLMYERLRKTSS